MWCPKKLQLPSCLSSFSYTLAFLIFIPLVLVLVLVCTLGPQSSYVLSFSSSSWTWRSVGLLRSLTSYEEKDQHLQVVGLVTFNNSAKDSFSNRPGVYIFHLFLLLFCLFSIYIMRLLI